MEGEAYGFHVYNKPDRGKILARGGALVHFESQIAWYTDHNIKLIFTINNHLGLIQPIWDGIEEILLTSPIETSNFETIRVIYFCRGSTIHEDTGLLQKVFIL